MEEYGPEVILGAARKRFLQWGFSGTSTAALAMDLGITKAALYYHFADKEALFLAVVRHYLAEVNRDLTAIVPLFEQGDAGRALGALASVFLSRRETSGQMQQLSFQESRHLSPQAQNDLSNTYHQAMVRPVAHLLDQAMARGWIRAPFADEPAPIWVFLGLLTAFLPTGHESNTAESIPPAAFVRLFTQALRADSASRS